MPSMRWPCRNLDIGGRGGRRRAASSVRVDRHCSAGVDLSSGRSARSCLRQALVNTRQARSGAPNDLSPSTHSGPTQHDSVPRCQWSTASGGQGGGIAPHRPHKRTPPTVRQSFAPHCSHLSIDLEAGDRRRSNASNTDLKAVSARCPLWIKPDSWELPRSACDLQSFLAGLIRVPGAGGASITLSVDSGSCNRPATGLPANPCPSCLCRTPTVRSAPLPDVRSVPNQGLPRTIYPGP